jgi:L-cysteate sulfo-lyase
MINILLQKFPALEFSFLPTPLHKMHNLSALLNVNVYCKRDDLTGFALGGNKTRKLDYLVADAITNGYDTLIAVGANQSNFCRMAAAAAKVKGLTVHLVLQGPQPTEYTGNLLIDKMLYPVMHHVDDMVSASVQLENELLQKGKKVYRLPWGGSTGIGALGYVQAGEEIYNQEKEMGLQFSKIFVAAGTGGMQAGLEVAKSLKNHPADIIGISVASEAKEIMAEVGRLHDETLKLIGRQPGQTPGIFIDDNYIGKGYGVRTKDCEEAVKLFAEKEAIFLDYVYTGKTAAGMIDYIKSAKVSQKDTVLFIHSGGNIELFE